MPRNLATARAYCDSSNELSAKEIENVFTVSDDARTANAATTDESIPPESSTPSGTSETSRIRTESANSSRSCSAASLTVGTGSRDPTVTPARLAAENALKSLLSLMDDCATLSEVLLQWMSTSQTARSIDREMGDLRHDLIGPAPLISYLRYNVTLAKESLSRLGIDFTDEKIETLSAMDDPGNMTALQDVGATAAKQQVRAEDFPASFDLAG